MGSSMSNDDLPTEAAPPLLSTAQRDRASLGAMSRQHTEREWDAMYPHIVQLYIGEQLILGEVMRIMETRYNFRATQSMYKKRIGKWQLHKYKRKSRPSPNQEEKMPSEKNGIAPIGRLIRRRGFQTGVAHDKTATMIPSQVPDVTIDKIAQSIVFDMQNLTLMNSQAHRWNVPPSTTLPASSGVGLERRSSIAAASQMYVTFSLGVSLYERQEGLLAGKAMRKAFLALEDVIVGNYFGLEWCLADLLYDFVQRGQHAVFVALVAHIANIAHLFLAESHPLARIASQLLRYEGDVATLLQRAYFGQVDTLARDEGVRGFLATHNRGLLPGQVPEDDAEREVVDGLFATMDEVEGQKGEGPGTPAAPLTHFIDARRRRSIALNNQTIDALVVGVSDRRFFAEFNPEHARIYRLKWRATMFTREGNWDEAVKAQREQLQAQKDLTGLDFWGIIRELWALEKLLVKAGADESEIEAVRGEARDRANTLLNTIPDNAV
ncbi:Clr5 domain-containing protein [Xylariaceae sp. FL0016]|nr:Clr5 domain-containing protein [Xylariaceae sp. FL0016]